MDWFERLTGFREGEYARTQAALVTDGEHLVCARTGRRSSMGRLELMALQDLRDRVGALDASAAQPLPNRFETVTGDVRELHRMPDAFFESHGFDEATREAVQQGNPKEILRLRRVCLLALERKHVQSIGLVYADDS